MAAPRFPGSDWLDRAQQGLWLRGASRVGRNVRLEARPFLQNEGTLTIEDDVRLVSRPVQSHLVVGRGAELTLGSGAVIGYGAALSANARVEIGAGTRIGPFVVIMDSDFHVAGDRNAEAAATPIRIGKGVVIESRVTILRGSSIGDGARIRSGSVVSGQIPAGVVAAGVPASVWTPGEDAAEHGALDVRQVVMKALALPAPPQLQDGPEQLPQWDSFGALKLLLALEKAYKLTIREELLKSARSVADLAAIVEQAKQAGSAARH